MRASKAPRQGNYRKDVGSKGAGAGRSRERVRPVREQEGMTVGAGDPARDEREGCTYKSLNRCFSRIRNSKKNFFSPPLSHPPVACGGLAAKFRVENA